MWFELDEIDSAIARAKELNAQIVMPRHRNPASGAGGPNHWECWLRDPDGYTVVLASPDGSVTPAEVTEIRCTVPRPPSGMQGASTCSSAMATGKP